MTKHTIWMRKIQKLSMFKRSMIRSPNVRASWFPVEGAVIISSISMVLKNLLQLVWSHLVMLNQPQIIIKSNYLIYEPIIYEKPEMGPTPICFTRKFCKREREKELKSNR